MPFLNRCSYDSSLVAQFVVAMLRWLLAGLKPVCVVVAGSRARGGVVAVTRYLLDVAVGSVPILFHEPACRLVLGLCAL